MNPELMELKIAERRGASATALERSRERITKYAEAVAIETRVIEKVDALFGALNIRMAVGQNQNARSTSLPLGGGEGHRFLTSLMIVYKMELVTEPGKQRRLGRRAPDTKYWVATNEIERVSVQTAVENEIVESHMMYPYRGLPGNESNLKGHFWNSNSSGYVEPDEAVTRARASDETLDMLIADYAPGVAAAFADASAS